MKPNPFPAVSSFLISPLEACLLFPSPLTNIKETALERAVFYAGWSDLSLSGRA